LSTFSEVLRGQITARARDRCEYCLLPTRGQVGRFPIDHVIPGTQGGPTEYDNLALACPHCNGRKWAHTEGTDSETGQPTPLFNPRRQQWSEHFQWSGANRFVLEGKTSTGRATIARLQMNHPDLVIVRRMLAELGVWLESTKEQ
jgi:hypothetical protein